MRYTTPTATGMIARLSAIAFAALLFAAAPARADDDGVKKIALRDAPAAVRETVVRVIGKGELDDLKRKFMLGKVVYEAEYIRDSTEHSVVVNEAGEVLQEAVEIKISETPDVVLKTARDKYPNGKITEVDRITANGKTFYEVNVELRDDDDERELTIAEDGTLLDDREDD